MEDDLSMSDVVAIGSVIVIVLGAFFTGVVQIITAIRSTAKETAAAVQEVKGVAETVKVTVQEVKGVAETVKVTADTVKVDTIALVKETAKTATEIHDRLDTQDTALTQITTLTNGTHKEQSEHIERLEALLLSMVQAKADQAVATEHDKHKAPEGGQ